MRQRLQFPPERSLGQPPVHLNEIHCEKDHETHSEGQTVRAASIMYNLETNKKDFPANGARKYHSPQISHWCNEARI